MELPFSKIETWMTIDAISIIAKTTGLILLIFVGKLLFFSTAIKMSTTIRLGKKSTAKEVLDAFGTGKYLDGKTAIVTGGNSGIGLELCKVLAHAGCRVILCSRSVSAARKVSPFPRSIL